MGNVGMIAACDINGLIGYDGKIPWHNKTDLKRFKQLTMNSTLIMGRKTYESLPANKLPGRTKYVLTYSPWGKEDTDDVKWFNDWKKALLACPRTYEECNGPAIMDAPDGPQCSCGEPSVWESGWCGRNKPIWIIGGEQVYKEALALWIPDFIDLTILAAVCIPDPSARLSVSAQKSVRLPDIPYVYMVHSEEQNVIDKMLWHRIYRKRPGGFESSFIDAIREERDDEERAA